MFLEPVFRFAENAWLNADSVVIVTSLISVGAAIASLIMLDVFSKKNHFEVAGKVPFKVTAHRKVLMLTYDIDTSHHRRLSGHGSCCRKATLC